jgi:pyruvate/2-oxoglutarate dehydrogenase complex dihydrolipoamide acyltransferase (E2) component
MFGITSFSAIINPPQSVIMAIGGPQEEVSLGPDGNPQAKPVMSITLSADQRVVDGEAAAALLDAFAKHFNNPAAMLLAA